MYFVAFATVFKSITIVLSYYCFVRVDAGLLFYKPFYENYKIA